MRNLEYLKRSLENPYRFWKSIFYEKCESEENFVKIVETLSRYAEWAVDGNVEDFYALYLTSIIIGILSTCTEENIVDFEKLADFVKGHYEKNFPHFRNIQKHEKIDAEFEWMTDCVGDIIEILKNE